MESKLKFLVELFSKSSQVEGSTLVAARRRRNSPALEALGGLGDLQERSPFYNSIRAADTLFNRLTPLPDSSPEAAFCFIQTKRSVYFFSLSRNL